MGEETGPPGSDVTARTMVAVPGGIAERNRDVDAGGSSISSPDAVLHVEEAQRTRIFGLFVFVLVVAVVGALQLIGGDATARRVHVGGLALAAMAAIWFVAVVRDARRYRPWHNVVLGHACVIAVSTGFYYWGPLSGVLLIVPFGAFIFSTGKSLPGALSVTIHLLAVHATLSIAITAGAVADRSLIQASNLPALSQSLVLLLVHLVFIATFLIARQVRASSHRAVNELASALRVLGQREAQLAEVQLNLRDVVIGDGQGRFSGQSVGSFRIGGLLGRGGMGEVYEASRTGDTEPRFAVKLLHPHLLADAGAYERFAREARASSALDSPHVVQVVEVSPDGATLPYLVMERLRGTDLATQLLGRSALTAEEVAELIRQVGTGLDAAHSAGIVHRDLKPQNVFRTEVEGRVVWKLLDFGVSKLVAGGGTLTHGHVVGTPGYMSPEQARGESSEVGPRSDLYSLGAIAYRALTGRPAVTAAPVPTMLYEVCHGMPLRPTDVAEVAPAFDSVLAIALAKEPAARFATPAALASAVAEAARGHLSEALRSSADAILARYPWRRQRSGL